MADNWDLQSLSVTATIKRDGATAKYQLLTKNGNPLNRFKGGKDCNCNKTYDFSNPVLISGTQPWIDNFPAPQKSGITVVFGNGGDDLRGGNNRAWGRVSIRGAVTEADLSQGQTWQGGSTHSFTMALPAGTRSNDIDSFELRADPNAKNGPFDSPDNWNVDQLTVEAVLTDLDTVGTWLAGYQDALGLMKGRGMAIGTDMNGFAPQMPLSAQPVAYPVTVASRFGTRPAGYAPPALGRDVMGSRTFDFERDGIAQYGMLPDFLQALSQKPGSSAALTALFRSANDVVEVWEKCQTARAGIR